jgi:hypothetical protein
MVTVQILVLFLNANISEELSFFTFMVEIRNMFLRNTGFETQDYTMSQRRRPQSGHDSILHVKPNQT